MLFLCRASPNRIDQRTDIRREAVNFNAERNGQRNFECFVGERIDCDALNAANDAPLRCEE